MRKWSFKIQNTHSSEVVVMQSRRS